MNATFESPKHAFILWNYKLLRGQGLHTFVRMLKYCFKDLGKEHFKVVQINLSYLDNNGKIDVYTTFGIMSTKNMVPISMQNSLIEFFLGLNTLHVKKNWDLPYHLCF